MKFWALVSVIAGPVVIAVVLELLALNNMPSGPSTSAFVNTISPNNTKASNIFGNRTSLNTTSIASAFANHTSSNDTTLAVLPTSNIALPIFNSSAGNKEIPEFNVAAVGDFDCNLHSRETISNIESKHPEVVLALGDLSYSSNFGCWEEEIRSLKPTMHIVVGNHDGGAHDRPTAISMLPALLDYFHLAKQYYSFNYRNAHFTVMSTELPLSAGSEQYKFVDKDLATASANSSITWKIVLVHKPAYASPGSHQPEVVLRDSMHPLFDKYDVDLVLQGHDHNYQRTFPLGYNALRPDNPIVTINEKADYANYPGEIWIIAGTGGASQYKLTGQLTYVAEQFTNEYGFLNLDFAKDGKVVVGNFYSNDGKILDSFTVRK